MLKEGAVFINTVSHVCNVAMLTDAFRIWAMAAQSTRCAFHVKLTLSLSISGCQRAIQK
jgi:hypothetical protein